MNKKIRMLGIDPGTHRIGYSILDKEGRSLPALVDYGTIEVESKSSNQKSLLEIRKALSDLVLTFKPDASSVEELFFNKNLKTAGSVYQARGVILLTLAENEIKIVEPSVTQIKKGVTGTGKADKKQIKEALKLILKLKDLEGHDDSWDAIAAAFVGFMMI